jgi:hypothetical protein
MEALGLAPDRLLVPMLLHLRADRAARTDEAAMDAR